MREILMKKYMQHDGVLRLLRAMKATGGIPKVVGLENIPKKSELAYGSHEFEQVGGKRYFQAVKTYAKKAGSRTIDIENEPEQQLFNSLYWMLSEAALKRHSFLKFVYDQHQINSWKKDPEFSKAILGMALETHKILGSKEIGRASCRERVCQ